MRNFFKSALLLGFLFSLSSSVKAQSKGRVHLGIGVDAGTSFKKASDPARFVLGGDARLQIPFGNGVSGILTTGYYHLFKKDYFPGYGIIPAKAGLKYFPAKNVYIAGEAGAAFAAKGKDVSFLYSPSAGLAFANGLDISLKYEGYTRFQSDASHLALRLAYGFKL